MNSLVIEVFKVFRWSSYYWMSDLIPVLIFPNSDVNDVIYLHIFL